NVREPAVGILLYHVDRVGAIHVHAPDLHQSRSGRVEPDSVAIRSIFGSIIEARHIGELRFWTTVDGDGVNIVLAAALGTICQALAAGRPAIKIAGSFFIQK